MIVVVGTTLVMIGGQFLGGAALMFAVGAVHTWIPVVPTIGYEESLAVVVCLSILVQVIGLVQRVSFPER